MDEPENLSPEEQQFLTLAVAIADGTPVNWADQEQGSSDNAAVNLSQSASLAPGLRVLERIVRGHRVLHESILDEPAAAESTPPGETLLSEARRTTDVPAGDLLRVEWGPLVVLDKIGRGSFGDVYRAWDPRLHREVALKLVNDTSPSIATSAFEEGRRLARVRHPNVVTVFGAERVENRVGIWMEYLRGRTLAEEIGERGRISATEAARIGIEVCRALSAVHGAGLLHRDVKAHNVMRDEEGRIVLGDFGTGVEYDESASLGAPSIAGTPLYMAPELFKGHSASTATDVYSVGVLLYFLVTGTYPTRGRTLAELRRAHDLGERTPLRNERPDLPPDFVQIVDALIEPGPDRRHGSAGSAASALADWLAREEGAGVPGASTRSGGARRPVNVAAVAVVAIVTLTALAWPLFGGRIRQWAGRAFIGTAPISRQIEAYPCTGPSSEDGQWIACVESPGHLRERGGTPPPPLVIFNPWTGETNVVKQLEASSRISQAVISPDGTRIAFTVMAPKQPVEVRTINTDGTAERVIMMAPADVTMIGLNEWSAHDQQIVARIWRANQTVAAALVSPDSGAMAVLLEFEGAPNMFSRSPDGRLLAYDLRPSPETSERDIRVCNVNSQTCETVASHPAIDVAPVWAPDGRLLFNSDRAGTMGLWEMEFDGLRPIGAPRLVRDTGRGRMGVAGFGPNGLVFYTLTFGDFDVYSASLEQAADQELTPVRLSPRAVDANRSPVWSPDGLSVAYVSRRGPFQETWGTRLVIQSLADGREREFKFDMPPNMTRLAWAPDSRILALRTLNGQTPARGTFGIHLVDVNTGNVIQTLRRTAPPQRAIEDQITDIAWVDPGTILFASISGLGAFDVQTGVERPVWDAPEGMTVHGMALSPDSVWTAVAMSDGPPPRFSSFFVSIVPIGGGESRELLRVKAPEVLWMQTWSRDGQSVLITRWDSSKAVNARRPQLWKLPIDGRSAMSLPLALPGLSELRIHPTGRRVAFTAGGSQTEFWMTTVK